MTNNATHLFEEASPPTDRTVEAISLLAKDSERQLALFEGHDLHGNAFSAFLLINGVNRLPSEELLEVFDLMHCWTFNSEEEVIEAILGERGWQDLLDVTHKTLGHEDLLVWDRERLREVMLIDYAVIACLGKWHVFALGELHSRTQL